MTDETTGIGAEGADNDTGTPLNAAEGSFHADDVHDPANASDDDFNVAAAEENPPEAPAPVASAPVGDNIQDELPQLPENPADDEPEEIYSGDWNPVPGVSIDQAPITEPMTDELLAQFAKFGKVVLTNMNLPEVLQLDQILRLRIMVAQRDRYDRINKGLPADSFIEIDMPQLGKIYMTDEEQRALNLINDFKRQVAFNHIGDIIEDDEKATNRPMVDGQPIMMGLASNPGNNDGLAAIREDLGLGHKIAVPFWASGFHARMAAPGALAQISLDTQLGQEKIREALESAGYALAAPAVFLNREITDHAIKHLISTTLGTVDAKTIKETLSILDFDQIVTSLAYATYPKGFPVTRRCVNSALNCDGEITDLMNINRMVIVLEERLDQNQLRFMSKRGGNSVVDLKNVKAYQEKMRPNISRYVELKPGIRLKLRIPTIAQYEATSTAWIDNMTAEAKALIGTNAREEDRQNYLVRAQAVSTVMAYAHWVEAIVRQGAELEDEPIVVKTRNLGENATPDQQFEADREIDEFLRDFASSPELTQLFTAALEKFIAAMTITCVCLPKVHCPKCGQPIDKDTGSKQDHPELVTINPTEFFFTLLRRKIASALRTTN